MIVIPGEVKLRIEELTKEQLVVEVLKLQRMLDSRHDRDQLKRLVALEQECDLQGSVLDKICELLHRFGYETPDMPSIAKGVFRALYDRGDTARDPGLVDVTLFFADGESHKLKVAADSPLAASPNWSVHVR